LYSDSTLEVSKIPLNLPNRFEFFIIAFESDSLIVVIPIKLAIPKKYFLVVKGFCFFARIYYVCSWL